MDILYLLFIAADTAVCIILGETGFKNNNFFLPKIKIFVF